MTPEPFNQAAHWEHVYLHKPDQETSWFQSEPIPSLDLIRAFAPPAGKIIDVGGGQSILAGRLIDEGFDLTVVDISPSAIERAKARIGASAQRVRWIVGDVTQLRAVGKFDLWHDRAVFHFLTNEDDRRKYVELAKHSITSGGHLVIGTFALQGPEKCSGLPVQRYDAAALMREFGNDAFELARSFQQPHLTPWGKPQEFLFAVLRKR